MSLRNPYRRSPSPWRWLGIGLLLVAGMILGAFGHRLWQRSIQAAREAAVADSVAALRAEIQQRDVRIAALEDQLAVIEAADMAGQLAHLQSTVDGLQADVTALRAELAGSAAAPADSALAAADTLPPEVHLTVARQMQSHSLSCESSASSMAARYHGVPLTEDDILAALPFHANPHLGFRGQVDGPTGGIEHYGVYAEPIAAVLNSRGVQATLIAGGLDGIKAALARGNPVVAWITYHCLPSTPVTVTVDDQQVTLVPYQHAVVVTGYNETGVWANDPYDGQEDFYATADFERALSYFDNMAIEVAGGSP